MFIIHPPVTKPCEPPAALAYLSATLKAHDHPCTVIDMGIESLHFILNRAQKEDDTWSKRAYKGRKKNISALRSAELFSNMDRYKRAVSDLNRLLENSGRPFDLQLSLGNYVDKNSSPLKSCDLRLAAEQFAANIFFPYFNSRLNELINLHQPGTIGFSLNYLSQALCTFAIIGFLKANYPHIKIVLGGGLVTTWLAGTDWQNPFSSLVDNYIGGKGEEPLLKLLGIRKTTDHVTPSYSGLLKQKYLSPGFILPYTTSRGCFWKKCSFCPEKSENNPYSHIQPNTTLNDLRTLIKETSPCLIHFLDNALSDSTLRALCVNPPGVPWYGFARIAPILADRDFCSSLKDSGCTMLKLGLESGNQDVLNRLEKGIDLELAARVLKNLHSVGIATYVYLLFGTPAESKAEAEQTLNFVKVHHEHISFLNLAIFNLPVCSTETDLLEISDFYDGDLAIYRNFSHPDKWNRNKVRRFLDTKIKRTPEIAAILKKNPPFFTSNHAPFLLRD